MYPRPASATTTMVECALKLDLAVVPAMADLPAGAAH